MADKEITGTELVPGGGETIVKAEVSGKVELFDELYDMIREAGKGKLPLRRTNSKGKVVKATITFPTKAETEAARGEAALAQAKATSVAVVMPTKGMLVGKSEAGDGKAKLEGDVAGKWMEKFLFGDI